MPRIDAYTDDELTHLLVGGLQRWDGRLDDLPDPIAGVLPRLTTPRASIVALAQQLDELKSATPPDSGMVGDRFGRLQLDVQAAVEQAVLERVYTVFGHSLWQPQVGSTIYEAIGTFETPMQVANRVLAALEPDADWYTVTSYTATAEEFRTIHVHLEILTAAGVPVQVDLIIGG